MIVFFDILPLEGIFGLVEMKTPNNFFVIIIYCLNFEQSIGLIYIHELQIINQMQLKTISCFRRKIITHPAYNKIYLVAIFSFAEA